MKGKPRITSLAQLHARCAPQSTSGCILYPPTAHRYGVVTTLRGRRTVQAAAWELANDMAVPPGLVVRHTCDTPHCTNPDHLELGTQADNMRDKVTRGRTAKARTKLTSAQVMLMHTMRFEGYSIQAIADKFGVHYVTAQYILSGKNHRKEYEATHLPAPTL